MSQTIHFTIPGVPVAKGRPRFGQGRVWTPEKTVDFEQRVRVSFLRGFADLVRRCHNITCPISVSIKAIFPFTKAHNKIDRLCENPKTTKPDCDNLIKSCLDSLNGYAWRDDNLVYKCDFIKVYGEVPRTEISITYEDNSL